MNAPDTIRFEPHALLRSGHSQTIAGWALRRRIVLTPAEDRLFDVAPGVQVLCRCHWQGQEAKGTEQEEDGPALTLILVHGLEGSAESQYIRGTAQKAFAAGMNVVRMNIRNCGGTEHLSATLYHSGLSQDLGAVAAELARDSRVNGIALAGFSLGGNQVLKLAGEWGDAPPPYVRAVAAVSPAMDLGPSCDLLHARPNRIYEWHFLRTLRKRARAKIESGRGTGNITGRFREVDGGPDFRALGSMREFDDRVTAPAFGFASAADYYAQASASPGLSRISLPALIIYALDDPFICVLPETREHIRANPHISVLECEHGGHCAFIGAHGQRWAEKKVVQFISKAAR